MVVCAPALNLHAAPESTSMRPPNPHLGFAGVPEGQCAGVAYNLLLPEVGASSVPLWPWHTPWLLTSHICVGLVALLF